jgi:hypothetical protein
VSGPGLADLVADSDAELDEVILGTGFAGITDIKVGPDGLLYVLSFGAGAILRVEPAAAQPATLSLGFVGLAADRVGQSGSGPAPDGVLDGTFILTLLPGSGARTLTRLELHRPDSPDIWPDVWDTVPSTGWWTLGVAGSLDGQLLNGDSGINVPLSAGASLTLFAADVVGLFAPGSSFTITATFADGSITTATTKTP